ncbi:peptide-N(4)-(N-acetyl-beta-glucosaminyl)asparagine amidase-like [Mya arenaria]|uniref:peptide-N(4)-(N-acetyl-beta- glucosaminyl)asparagine amidase-like n=1 Tax=Mya arenaria TaxID=6604 RepID=UPI0022E4AB5D|nr:peptide-N(4)-(N-acetyl-beta-glucosaminyl)asparagine amidase-like [Mya arenaria]
MAPVTSSVQQLVNENPPKDFLTAAELLIKFASNVLKSPHDQKYRKIRLGNPTVENKLLPVSGAMECLFEMGFVEDGEFLSLPQSAPLSVLSHMRSQLETERALAARTTPPSGASQGPVVSSDGVPLGPTQATGRGATSAPVAPVNTDNQQMLSEATFFRKLQSGMQTVLVYENARLQQKARDVIPISQLEEEARETLASFSEPQEAGSNPGTGSDPGALSLDIRDCLVLALLKWFKTSFFKWVDAPACKRCGGKTSFQSGGQPTAEELRYEGNRVEVYRCNVCGELTRFVRYNNPGKLLETREGRCGEWANCFTLCCRALGFEARYVLDWTDHVWTEVYSESQQRWVHCDPCENACDKPLIYEVGWGKKLTYIIAFSVDDIEDVTWRYSADFEALLSRRKECREMWLVKTLYNLDKSKWTSMPEGKKNQRLKRKVAELVEFMTPKKADGKNLSGRSTGSVEWRLARGEMGTQPAQEAFTFTPTANEKAEGCLHVQYSCKDDAYTRVSSGNAKTRGWQACVNEGENIFRKEELDWKMVYLARTEGSSSATISWKFDFAGSGLCVDKVDVRADHAVYENGKVTWTLCTEETCVPFTGGPQLQTVTGISGATSFTLNVHLTGGRGGIAWQHTQLFRQSMEDSEVQPFEVKVILKKH